MLRFYTVPFILDHMLKVCTFIYKIVHSWYGYDDDKQENIKGFASEIESNEEIMPIHDDVVVVADGIV